MAKDANNKIPKASYTGDLPIGELIFPCSVLSDGTRILTQGDFMSVMGMYYSGKNSSNKTTVDGSAPIPSFLSSKQLEPFVRKHFNDLHHITVRYRTKGGAIANGILAEIIPRVCDVWIDAQEAHDKGTIKLGETQQEIARKAKLLMRALAHTGIIALVDEVTGYQKDRASDALVKILESFIAKELQPWIKTFPDEFYEHLFRLRGLNYPTDTVKRPSYFGYLTNDIIYKRLAPGVLEELRNSIPKLSSGKRKYHLHRKLTSDVGHPKLREHLASVITIMKLSKNYNDFKNKLDIVHPVYGETLSLQFEQEFDISDISNSTGL
ncbi:P63C domain-containing protein [Anabaena azotica]|uniref:P63C domain-containing protein n=1 Tax=Anabaena azotica TaxID=197653 RepID=UPI0039A709A8